MSHAKEAERGNGRGEANRRGFSKVDSGLCRDLKPCLFPFEVLDVGFFGVGTQMSATQEEEDGGAQRKQAYQLYGQESPDLRLTHLQGSQGEARGVYLHP